MGNLMREYWIPALLPSELPAPDCPPVRLRLLGENLVAFRITSGKVGIVVNACPHRGASMFFGRNEEEGLRCVYHGWKFDVAGSCVDMPSEPSESNFKSKVRIRAYPTRERGGVIWTYMGPRETPPPLPQIESNSDEYPSSGRKILRECNFVQALEGDIDTSHVGFLHRIIGRETEPGSFERFLDNDRAPRYAVAETGYGTIYGAYRPAEEDTYYWRFGQFLFPFWTMPGTGLLGGPGSRRGYRAWVPVDDANTMFWSLDPVYPAPEGQGVQPAFAVAQGGFKPDTSDWLGRWRLSADRSNDYFIDREQQAAGNFTGVTGIHLQDQAITESMGEIYARNQEHLGTSDQMVIRTRQRLINAAKALRDHGTPPPAVDEPELYMVRSGGVVLPRDADWLEATSDLRQARPDDYVVLGRPARVGLT